MARAGRGGARLRPAAVLAALAALVAMLACAPVAGAQGWGVPETLALPGDDINDQQLVATPAGEAVAVWIEQGQNPIRAFAAVKRADGKLDGPVELAADVAGCVLDIATDAAGNVVVVWIKPDGEIDAIRRPAGGRWGVPEVVRQRFTDGGFPRVAMNARGDAVVLWRALMPDGWITRISVSRGGLPWGPPVTLESLDPGGGGYDVALTPDGEAVAVWAVDPDGPGPTQVRAASVSPTGVASPVQTLAASSSTKTCPQVEANARGEVAALWHEIDGPECPGRGDDVLALRPPGALSFSPAQPVPGAQSAALAGTLSLADDGTLAVSYDRSDGGQLVAGPFGGPLAVTSFAGERLTAAGGDERGAQLVALNTTTAPQTVSREADSSLSPREALTEGCEAVEKASVDVGAGRGAALLFSFDHGLQLAVQRADAPARSCPADAAGVTFGGPPPAERGGSVQGGRPAPGFAVQTRGLHLLRRRRAAVVTVECPQRCALFVAGSLRAGRRTVARGSRRLVTPAGARRVVVPLRRAGGRRLRRRGLTLAVRVVARGPLGERSVVHAERRAR